MDIEKLQHEINTLVLALDPKTQESISALASVQDLEEIYGTLADEELQTAFPGKRVEQGKRLFENAKGEIREKLCANSTIKAFCQSPRVKDAMLLASLIASALLKANYEGLNIPLASVLISRIGLESICKKTW